MRSLSVAFRAACLIVLCFVLGTFSPAYAGDFCPGDAYERPDSYAESGIEAKGPQSTARRIVDSVRRPGMSEYDLALALNDWLMDHTQYKSGVTGAYNVLKNGYASCSGYANAYCALLKQANIGHRRIAGKSFRFDHVWNLVRMGGEWYHVDVRMNDSSQSHAFFGLTHEAISYNHQGFSTSKNCGAYRYNYDYVNGVYDQAIEYIESAIEDSFAAGQAAFMISLADGNRPSTLNNPIQARMIKAVIESKTYGFAGENHQVKLSLLDDAIAVYIDRPFVAISSITLDRGTVKIKGADISKPMPTYQLNATVYPANASNPVVFWRSRNEKVAVVDQNGLVTIVGYGRAEVMAMAEDGSKKTAKCVFTVNKK